MVVVVGGGLAGLTCAYELGKAGLSPIVLERSGHFGGKVMSAEGYGGFPIEHGVHGFWKGYGNLFDLLRDLHGDDVKEEIFAGPYCSRFTAKLPDGRVVSMVRPPPNEGEPRIMPLVSATLAMVKERALSLVDAASLAPLLLAMMAFDHAKDYARYRGETASGLCDRLGVTKRAQELVIANFTLASAFSPLDRVSAAALLSSANFYIFDAQASLEALWLRTHPDEVVMKPLTAAIESRGDAVPFARVLGLHMHDGKVTSVYVDRAHNGVLAAADVGSTPRDLFADDEAWEHTTPAELAFARATLRHHEHVWLARRDEKTIEAWRGAVVQPTSSTDDRWLLVEQADFAATRIRVFEDRYAKVGTLDERDIPEGTFHEVLWEGRRTFTSPEAIAELKSNLARATAMLAMHAANVTMPSHLPLYVGSIDGELRGYAGICTHFGGRLHYDRGTRAFACGLHGSRFDAQGARSCGPAEAGLFAFRLLRNTSGGVDVLVRRPPVIRADHVVLATDVRAMQHILRASPALHDDEGIRALMRMRTTSVTVARFVIGRRIDDALAIFSGFRLLDALFNVTKLQGLQLDRHRDRVHEVIELQILHDRHVGTLSRDALMKLIVSELREAYRWDTDPEVLEPVHVSTFTDIYSGFDCESEAVRPKTRSTLPGLVFAGDWVQSDEGAWYMERAVRTGRLAARAILEDTGGDPDRVPLVPPVREPWNLRDLARAGERGASMVLRTLRALLLGAGEKR